MADNFVLYLDECGDQNLSSFDPQFPIFTLCGVVVSEEQDELLADRINSLKRDIWNNTNIILHSRDIRKCQNGFEVLFDLEVKKRFIESVNAILGDDIYIIICCAILKEPYIRQYGKLNDVYGLSLSFIMERVVFYLDSVGKDNIELRTVIERRGKKEDKCWTQMVWTWHTMSWKRISIRWMARCMAWKSFQRGNKKELPMATLFRPGTPQS